MASETKRVETAEQKKIRTQREKHLRALCVNCGEPFGMHTVQMTVDCANARS